MTLVSVNRSLPAPFTIEKKTKDNLVSIDQVISQLCVQNVMMCVMTGESKTFPRVNWL